MLGCFLRVACHAVTSQFACGHSYRACEGYGVLDLIYDRTWELLFEAVFFHFLERFDVDSVLGVLAIARCYEVAFTAKRSLG